MSDVQAIPAAAAVPAAEPTETTAAATTTTTTETPAVAGETTASEAPKTETAVLAGEETKADAVAPVDGAKAETTAAADKAVEPITEGQLAYKGPGVLKSLIPMKKEFWLNDAALKSQDLNLFLRGEKPEIAHPVAAWATQTGRGLLFFQKKGESERVRPTDVLALYDAVDLKKEHPHQFVFKIGSHNHSFKAANDAERDGWYLSVEKAIELGKASKAEIQSSEGYKAELEKLNKPHPVGGAVAGATAAKRSQSQPQKSTEAEAATSAPRTGSDAEPTDKKKSRSTSRGVLNRFKGKKEEVEQKVVEKKEEKEAEKEVKKAEKEEAAKPDIAAEAPAVVEPAAVSATAPAGETTAETAAETTEAKTEEQPKAAKRGSIFGRVQSGWNSMKSPSKEKDQKEVELKPEVPAKDVPVSENPPVLPETAATTTTAAAETTAVPAVAEPATEAKPETATKDAATEPVSPGKEKSKFLSGGLGFMKRNRSVSPSTNAKDAPKPAETAAVAPVAPATTTEATTEPVAKPEEAAAATEPVVDGAEKPAEKAEESKTETPAGGKRGSVFGTIGRRASKAFRGMQGPKKEGTTTAAADAKKEEGAEVKAADETPAVNGETKASETEAPKSIGDVVPDAVNVGEPPVAATTTTPVVTASA